MKQGVLVPLALICLVTSVVSQCTTKCSAEDGRQEALWENGAAYFRPLFETALHSGLQQVLDKLDETQRRLDDVERNVNGRIDDVNKRLDDVVKNVNRQLDDVQRNVNRRIDDVNENLTLALEDAQMKLGADVVILRRQDGSVNFQRGWADYKKGFGDPVGEFWIGLERLHALTFHRRYLLHVDLRSWGGGRQWAEYGTVILGPEGAGYRLYLRGFDPSSSAGDSLTAADNTINGMKFTTMDRDNHEATAGNCANGRGGWWYGPNCSQGSLTGVYGDAAYRGAKGVIWYTAGDDYRSFKSATLTLRAV